jgi:hypothetical protein
LSRQQIVLLLTPPLLLATTYGVYRLLVPRLGRRGGYLAGFLFYWLGWCLILPLALLGPQGIRDLFRVDLPGLGQPWWLALSFLVIPLLLGFGYAFPRALRAKPGWRSVVISVAIALVNGILEEVLWRGAYVSLFPDQWLLAVLYPAVGFGVWHFSPQSVFPNRAPGGNLSLVLVAAILGLLWGWVAYASGSIGWTVASHVLFDFSGLGGRVYVAKR